jgi:hypothetical protein
MPNLSKVHQVPTPELDKMTKVKDQSQAIGEFLEWLQSKKWSICSEDEGNYFPITQRIEEILAKYFKINLDKAERERQAILNNIRKQNKED